MSALAAQVPRVLTAPLPSPRTALAAALALAAPLALWTLPEGLAPEGRKALAILALAVIGWTMTRLPEAFVAIAAAVALVLTGAAPERALYATLGDELVWLLLAAFVIAAVVKESGLAERALAPFLARRPRFATLVAGLTLAIAATAFVLPSTSGRAALLLPVFAAVAAALPDPRLVRPLALLFPSVILLSAGGSLIGAGAHLVAVEAIRGATGLSLGYLDWSLLGLPLAMTACAAAAALILALFTPRALLMARIDRPAEVRPGRRHGRMGVALAALVALWASEPWHGLGAGLVALLGALALLTPAFTDRKTKDVFRAVDVELLVYMAATMLIARAVAGGGADRWLAGGALAALPAGLLAHPAFMAAALAALSVAAHLAVVSRSARAAVLIPAVALPAADLGHDAAVTVLIAVMGTGFCQTLTASAKPVAVFAGAHPRGFAPADLLRLALVLAPLKAALVAGFALTVWPAQLATMRGDAPATASAPAAAVAAPAPVPDATPRAPAAPSAPTAEPGPVAAPDTTAPTRPAVAASAPPPAPRPARLAASRERDAAQSLPAPPADGPPRSLGEQLDRDIDRLARDIRRDLGRLFD
jgi:di/tricarboxylate transporter